MTPFNSNCLNIKEENKKQILLRSENEQQCAQRNTLFIFFRRCDSPPPPPPAFPDIDHTKYKRKCCNKQRVKTTSKLPQKATVRRLKCREKPQLDVLNVAKSHS